MIEGGDENDGNADKRDLKTGESHLELRLPSFQDAPPNRRMGKVKERPKRGRPQKRHPRNQQRPPGPGRTANRRTALAYQDYDPRPEQGRNNVAKQNIFPIPVEFLQQIQGGPAPGKFRPENFEFNPSAQIEEIGTIDSAENHIDNFAFVPEEGIKPTLFTLDEGVPPTSGQYNTGAGDKQPVARSAPQHHSPTSQPIFREEYPAPSLTPYSQVPYHDARHTTPHSLHTTPRAVQVSKEKVLHYMAPPNQVTNTATNIRVMLQPILGGNLILSYFNFYSEAKSMNVLVQFWPKWLLQPWACTRMT